MKTKLLAHSHAEPEVIYRRLETSQSAAPRSFAHEGTNEHQIVEKQLQKMSVDRDKMSEQWAAELKADMQPLFLRAARVVGSRSFDFSNAVRHQIAAKLEQSGVAPQKTGKLKEFMPVGSSERISLHDESLPPGLILSES